MHQDGQSGRLGGAIAGHHGGHCPHLKARGWSPDSGEATQHLGSHREAVALEPGRGKLTDLAAFDHSGTPSSRGSAGSSASRSRPPSCGTSSALSTRTRPAPSRTRSSATPSSLIWRSMRGMRSCGAARRAKRAAAATPRRARRSAQPTPPAPSRSSPPAPPPPPRLPPPRLALARRRRRRCALGRAAASLRASARLARTAPRARARPRARAWAWAWGASTRAASRRS